MTGLVQANNHMAVALYKLLAKEGGNMFFSPFSISCAMAMLYQGARSQAALELRTALGYDDSDIKDDVIESSYKSLLKTVESGEGYVLNCANSLLVHRDFIIKESYLSKVKEMFEALVLQVDFQQESSKAVSQINKWVGEKTNQMIPRMLDELDPETVVVLLNAVYFKGNWKNPFCEEVTYPEPFYNRGLEECAIDVPMMRTAEFFEFTRNESYCALQLPYLGDNVAMLLILPNAMNGLKDLESQLNPSFVEEVRNNMRRRRVDVRLPRFSLEYGKSLQEAFQAMGVNDIFHKGTDLGGMSDSRRLTVSQIIHKAVVEVNEKGTEATVVTTGWVSIEICGYVTQEWIVVDHPFLFTIFDTRSNLQIFLGKVEALG